LDDNILEVGDYENNYYNIILKDFKIDGNSANQSSGGGLVLNEYVYNVLVSNLYIYDIKQSGLYADGFDYDLMIENCRIENTGEEGLYLFGCYGIVVKNNQCLNCGNESYSSIFGYYLFRSLLSGNNIYSDCSATSPDGILLTDSCYNKITDNTMYGVKSGYHTIHVWDDCMFNVVSGNSIGNTYSHGIDTPAEGDRILGNSLWLISGHGIYAKNTHLIISDNEFRRISGDSIYVWGYYSIITNNNFWFVYQHGINLYSASYCIITDNLFHVFSWRTNNLCSGVFIQGSAGWEGKYNTIKNNHFINETAYNKGQYAICEYGANCDYNFIGGNRGIKSVIAEFYIRGLNTEASENYDDG